MGLELLSSAGGAFTSSGDLWVANHISGVYDGYLALVRVCGFRDVGGVRRKVLVDQYFKRVPKTKYGIELLNRERTPREIPMKVIVINPTELPKLVEIDGSLESLQGLIGGYLEVLPFTTGSSAYVDEEAKVKTPEPAVNLLATQLFNRVGPGLFDTDYIRGPMVIVGNLDEYGEHDGDEHDVPEDVIKAVMDFHLD